jgi:hypothetical protein
MPKNWQQILERVAWTFAQAFVAVLIPAMTMDVLGNPDAIKSVALSALIAGLAAVLSLAKNYTAYQLRRR